MDCSRNQNVVEHTHTHTHTHRAIHYTPLQKTNTHPIHYLMAQIHTLIHYSHTLYNGTNTHTHTPYIHTIHAHHVHPHHTHTPPIQHAHTTRPVQFNHMHTHHPSTHPYSSPVGYSLLFEPRSLTNLSLLPAEELFCSPHPPH